MMTEFEAGVRELVARLRDFDRRMKKVEDDAGELEQFVKLIRPGLGFEAAGPPPPNTTLNGSVIGCGVAGVAASLTVKETVSGTVLWTGTTSNGSYSANFYLATNTALTLDGVPTSTHLASGSFSLGTITAGATTSVPNKQFAPATGMNCFLGCAFPFNNTINCLDHHYAVNVTLTWNGTDRWSGTSGGRTYAVFAASGQMQTSDGNIATHSGTCAPIYTMPTTGFTYNAGDKFDITDNP